MSGGDTRVGASGRAHPTVNHSPAVREWARDDDGDGVREVPSNTSEGVWSGLRNHRRPFRGVNKWFLSGYVAGFEWTHNLKVLTSEFVARMIVPVTSKPT